MNVAEINLSASSITTTGALRYKTAFHSVQLRGVIWNNCVKKGMYRIAKCKAMLKVIAATKKGLRHTGNRNKLSFSESEFMALNISTVTRIDKLIVVAR